MRIAVCLKHIPDGRLQMDPGAKRLVRSGSGEINKVDLNALEEALRLKDADGEIEVVTISMGPSKASDSLRTSLAIGSDRAVLISDDAAVGSDLLATAKVLARAIEREDAALVFFGQQASDSGGGALWAAVAERLRRPHVSQVTGFTMAGESVTVTRQTEFGDETVETSAPLVVSVTDAINQPRYASLRGQMSAKRKPLEVLSLADLGISPDEAGEMGSKTTVASIGDPPERAGATKIEDEGNAAQEIVDFLAARQVL